MKSDQLWGLENVRTWSLLGICENKQYQAPAHHTSWARVRLHTGHHGILRSFNKPLENLPAWGMCSYLSLGYACVVMLNFGQCELGNSSTKIKPCIPPTLRVPFNFFDKFVLNITPWYRHFKMRPRSACHYVKKKKTLIFFFVWAYCHKNDIMMAISQLMMNYPKNTYASSMNEYIGMQKVVSA